MIQHEAARLSNLLRCCLVGLRYAYCPKQQFQKYRNSSISQTVPSLPVDVLEDVEKTAFQICFEARNLNEKHRSLIFQTTDDFKSIALLSFRKMLPSNCWR